MILKMSSIYGDLPADIWKFVIIPLLHPKDTLKTLAQINKTFYRHCTRDGRLRRYYWGYLQRDIDTICPNGQTWIIDDHGTYRIREELLIPMKTLCGIFIIADDVIFDGRRQQITFLCYDPNEQHRIGLLMKCRDSEIHDVLIIGDNLERTFEIIPVNRVALVSK